LFSLGVYKIFSFQKEKQKKENTMTSALMEMKAAKLSEIDVKKAHNRLKQTMRKMDEIRARISSHIQLAHSGKQVS